MSILSFNKPKRTNSPKDHAVMYSSDSEITGTYVPNMSQEDQERWKAKYVNRGKDDARIEIRKTVGGAQLLIFVVGIFRLNMRDARK